MQLQVRVEHDVHGKPTSGLMYTALAEGTCTVHVIAVVIQISNKAPTFKPPYKPAPCLLTSASCPVKRSPCADHCICLHCADKGDGLVVHDAGAYCMAMASTYNLKARCFSNFGLALLLACFTIACQTQTTEVKLETGIKQ